MIPKKILFLVVTLIASISVLYGQRVITGNVMDSTGAPLQSVSVLVGNSSTGTSTDENGRYKVSVAGGSDHLNFSLVGYEKQTASVGNKNEINVTMTTARAGLAEVVVVGYGVQRKRDVTGTISSVKGEDLKNLPVSNPA